jgi:spore germination protein
MYNVYYEKIASDNKIPLHQTLVVGQTIVILTGKTNPTRQIDVNGYAFPNIDTGILEYAFPSLTYLSIFSYAVMSDGSLRTINDDKLISMAKDNKVVPVMVITNIGEEGHFSSNLAHQILIDETIQNKLITNVFSTMYKKGYSGLDIDFEYVPPEDRDLYINFLSKVRQEINRRNSFLVVAVAPKYSDDQKGVLYEAHDYQRIGELADHVIIMNMNGDTLVGKLELFHPLI